jgi:anti-sigma-K factor RskA
MSDEHQRWSDDVAAYLLGALDPAAASELERHLEGCDRCREEIRRLDLAVQTLPDSIEVLEPPRRLRNQLLAEVRADARAARAAEHEEKPSLGIGDRLRSLRLGPFGWRPVAALTTLLLALAVVAGYEVGDPGSGDGSLHHGRQGGVSATVATEGERGTLRLSNLRNLPPDRVLEAWVQREGKVEPVQALFVPDRNGHAATTIPDMNGVELVMVTAEPPGGSRHPTSEVIVSVPVQ